MISSVEFDLQAFEATKKEAEKAFQKLGEMPARKVLIEAANDGLVNALRRHFAMREQEMPRSTGSSTRSGRDMIRTPCRRRRANSMRRRWPSGWQC